MDEKKIKEDIDHIKNAEACFGYEVAVFNSKEDAIKYLENLTKKSNPPLRKATEGQEINPSANSGQVEK